MTKYQQIVQDLKVKGLFNPDIFEVIEKQTLTDDPGHEDRIKVELKEIKKAGLIDYYIELIQSGKKYHNTINSQCAYVWEITPEDPEDKDLNWEVSGEYPDIDSDFSPEKRNAIKEYCAQEFGREKVVSICNYNHFGIKSGIRDISRVLEVPLDDVVFTTRLDDDVNKMSWEESVEIYPELAAFEEKYPEVCRLVRDFNGRVRSIGKHAAGLVISNVDLSKTIPLITREDPETGERFLLSSFAEGQDRSDLKPFGLIKQDILGLENLNYISTCLNILESRGLYDPKVGMFKLSPEHEEWSDEAYLSDPASIEMANKGDLKGIFQFDSPGMRDLAKRGGISCFGDMVAMTALFRPGPLGSSMTEAFIQRKSGNETYEHHPILDSILGDTYSVCAYQEQLMFIMNKVGLISLQDCDNIRRAMGKKKLKDFIKYKDQFCVNGQKTLGSEWIGYYRDYKGKFLEVLSNTDSEFYQRYLRKDRLSEEGQVQIEVELETKFAEYRKAHKELKFVEDLWDQMVTFASYGFNKCITYDSMVETKTGFKQAGECKFGDVILAYNPETEEEFWDEVVAIYDNGEAEVYQVELDNEMSIECTLGHELMCEDGKKRTLDDITSREERIGIVCLDQGFTYSSEIHGMCSMGVKPVMDLEMKSRHHNFFVNGIAVGNSHALAYTMVSSRCLYLKAHYPKEYFAAVLSHLKTGDNRIKIYIQDARTRGINFLPLEINKSKLGFSIDPETDSVIIGFNKVKGISKEAEALVKNQPYTSITDFTERYGSNKKVTEVLVKAGAFENFERNMNILLKYFEYHRENKNQEIGMGKNDFSKMYKELSGAKSCPKTISSQLDQFLNGRKRIPYEELVVLDFSFASLAQEKVALYLDLNQKDFQKRILPFEEFKEQPWIKEMKDFYDEERFAFEEELYGFVFHHPLDGYERQDMLLGDVIKSKGIGIVEGIITDIQTRTAKNGSAYYIVTVEDEYDQMKILLWSNQYSDNQSAVVVGTAIRVCVMPSMFATWNLTKSGKIEKMTPIDSPDRKEARERKSLEGFNQFLKETLGNGQS